MWPFLKTGEKVMVKKVSAEDLRIGDIILYRLGNQMVCHRLVKKVASASGYLIYAWGDASPYLGEPITEKALVGKVISILRNGRIISFTGIGRHFVNRLIAEFGPFIRIGIKIMKRLR
jgi:signal peptidase I